MPINLKRLQDVLKIANFTAHLVRFPKVSLYQHLTPSSSIPFPCHPTSPFRPERRYKRDGCTEQRRRIILRNWNSRKTRDALLPLFKRQSDRSTLKPSARRAQWRAFSSGGGRGMRILYVFPKGTLGVRNPESVTLRRIKSSSPPFPPTAIPRSPIRPDAKCERRRRRHAEQSV